MVSEIKLNDGEQIIKTFLPNSKIRFEYYFKRSALILTNERMILKGVFKIFDKEIKYEDISDVLVGKYPDNFDLQIIKKGLAPNSVQDGLSEIVRELLVAPGQGLIEYKPYIRCGWLSEVDKRDVVSFIKEKIKVK